VPGNNDCTCRANLLERALLGLGGIKEVGDMGAKWVRGALLYFGAVFGAGFLLGLLFECFGSFPNLERGLQNYSKCRS